MSEIINETSHMTMMGRRPLALNYGGVVREINANVSDPDSRHFLMWAINDAIKTRLQLPDVTWPTTIMSEIGRIIVGRIDDRIIVNAYDIDRAWSMPII